MAVIIPPVHTGCEVIPSQHAYHGGGQNPQDEDCGKLKFSFEFLSLCSGASTVALQGNTEKEFGVIKNFGRSQLHSCNSDCGVF